MFSVRGYFEHPDNKERLRDVMCLYFCHENNTIDEAIDLYYKKDKRRPLKNRDKERLRRGGMMAFRECAFDLKPDPSSFGYDFQLWLKLQTRS